MWPRINCKKNLLFKFLNFLVNWFYYIRFYRFLCKTTDVFQQNKNLSDFPFILNFSRMLCQRKNMFWYHVSYLNVLKVIKGAHFIIFVKRTCGTIRTIEFLMKNWRWNGKEKSEFFRTSRCWVVWNFDFA